MHFVPQTEGSEVTIILTVSLSNYLEGITCIKTLVMRLGSILCMTCSFRLSCKSWPAFRKHKMQTADEQFVCESAFCAQGR